jgi:hypothetical protein
MALGPNDGGRNSFCTCPRCMALDSARGRKVLLWDFAKGTHGEFEHVSLTDRTVFFWNTVAEQVATARTRTLRHSRVQSVAMTPTTPINS